MERDTDEANQYVEKLKTGWKGNSVTDAWISENLAWIYQEAGLVDKAEAYYRKVHSIDPENHFFLNDLAALLIAKDLDISAGLELIDKALELSPDHYEYLDTKGWALNKLGKYQEALEILQKSWDLRMKNAVYSHHAFLNLEAAKKAVAAQN